jgi:hypothetical protein
MSDLRLTKKEREKAQVRAFLVGRRMPFQSLEDGPDPPDVRVLRDGLPSLGVEVTEYHPDADRVGIQLRWSQLREILDELIRQSPALKGVHIGPIFQDNRIPSRSRHLAIAEELVRCAEHSVKQGWLGQGELKLSFQEWVPPTKCYPMTCAWFVFSAREWPTLARFVSVLNLFSIDFAGYLPTNNPQAQAAYCSPYGDAFLTLLEEKERSIRTAIAEAKYLKGESPLWLLIGCNTKGDLSSEIFGSEDLRRAVDESGFDFANSPFDEVWLMDDIGGGRSQRIYPWGDRT